MKKDLTNRQVAKIRKAAKEGTKQKELAIKYGVTSATISKIINNTIYAINPETFIIGEVEWEDAQDDVYLPDYVDSNKHEQMERLIMATLLNKIVELDILIDKWEVKYGVKSDELILAMCENRVPYCDDITEFDMAVKKRDKLITQMKGGW
jgi:hypothetical protein